MLFNSIQFLLFFPTVVLFYFLIPPRQRWIFLLLASYIFYACWKVEYVWLILASTLTNYFAAIRIHRCPSMSLRKRWLYLGLGVNLGLLFFFKYFNFLSVSSQTLAHSLFGINIRTPVMDFLLPVGISFYTFQSMAYTLDVYWGRQKPERHVGLFALYVSFFPQLVAGPIERAQHLLPQFRKAVNFDYDRTVSGLRLIAWGFFKKLVIADRLAVIVDNAYSNPTEFSGLQLIFATYFFAYQIYCDFSGYSDIAIGTARILGINLMNNFAQPYFARNIKDFWRRWHISLTTWFRDYLYFPLGGNRVPQARWAFNIMIVFAVSGLWHGASWTFLIWGVIHGSLFALSERTKTWRATFTQRIGLQQWPTLHKAVQMAITFNLVSLAWIFFRAETISDAFYICTHLFYRPAFATAKLGTGRALAIAILSIVILETIQLVQRKTHISALISRQPAWVRWSLYYGCSLLILCLGMFGQSSFIYFQF